MPNCLTLLNCIKKDVRDPYYFTPSKEKVEKSPRRGKSGGGGGWGVFLESGCILPVL